MNGPKAEIEGISIVLLGVFNPTIFQPAWFALQELIRREEAETAKIDVIHPEVVAVTIGSIKLQIMRGRFSGETADPSAYEVLRDLTLSTFGILRHTPVGVMGLNSDSHFGVPSEEAWHTIGHRLAPKELWTDLLEKPGMRSLTIEGVRTDGHMGYIQVRVEPSLRVHPGVYVNVNDHYQIKDYKPEQGCDAVMDILKSNWKAFFDRSHKAVKSLMEL